MFLHGFQPYSLWPHCMSFLLSCVCACVHVHASGHPEAIFQPSFITYNIVCQNDGAHKTSRRNTCCTIQPSQFTDSVSIGMAWSHSPLYMLGNINKCWSFLNLSIAKMVIRNSFGHVCGDRVLRNNQLNGTLDIGTSYSNELKLIDLQKNSISEVNDRGGGYNVTLM